VVLVLAVLAALALPACNDQPVSRILVVGDSLTVGAENAGLGSRGPVAWTINAVVGRTTYQASVELAKLQPTSYGEVVVVVGTNDADLSATGYRTEIERVMKVIGPKEPVIWVNVDSHSPQMAQAARGVDVALDQAAAAHANLRIADWDAYVLTVPGFSAMRGSDGTHYTPQGYAVRATWLERVAGVGPQAR
jgi:lysophospholipase L1-like esterase